MNSTISIGKIELTFVSGGRLWIDGGTMFGVVPRVLWEREAPPDAQNRIPLATHCVLVRGPDSLGLIDTGYGNKASQKFRQRHALEEGPMLANSLSAVAVGLEMVDWVVLTH